MYGGLKFALAMVLKHGLKTRTVSMEWIDVLSFVHKRKTDGD
jgi:hypothetical protein